MIPSPYQQAIYDWIEYGSGNALVDAVAGAGKCLGENTPVLLFDGRVVPVQEIASGDLLMGPDSRPRRVLSTCTGFGSLYRIVPVKGTPWVCNDVHILTLAGTNRLKGKMRDVPLNCYLVETRPSPSGRIDRQWKLLRVGVDFPDVPVEIEPYLAGVWLGDGTTDDVAFTVMDQSILDYLTEIAPRYGAEAVMRIENERGLKHVRLRMGQRGQAGRHTPSILRRELLGKFRNGNGEKTIPQNYLANSREKRLRLLAGLIDTDGYYAKEKPYYEIATKHQHLAEQILFLARSLGFAAYAVSKPVYIQRTGKTNIYYRITIAGNVQEIPCRVPYKQAQPRRQIKDVRVTGWSAEPLGEGPYYGFTLDGDGHFLLGDFTVTHNTTTLLEGVKRLKTTNACFVAFNKVIADEIATRLQAGGSPMQASTIHSLGKRCLGKTRIEGNKYTKLCRKYIQSLPNLEVVLKDTPEATAVKQLRTLVNFTQLTRTEPTEANLLRLAEHYALDEVLSLSARNGLLWETIWSGVSITTEQGIEQYQRERLIDFNDMVCLPTELNLPTPQFDFIFIDEAQDLNRAQLEFVLACKSPQGRLLFVGDRRQSLYGFAGADTASIRNIITRTQATVLPLSICYRCPSLPVRLAQQIYPDIQPAPTAEPGIVQVITQAVFLKQVQPDEQGGCAVIGRCTAPLVSLCLKLLQQGKRAKVRGRDIGAGILDVIERLKKSKHFHFVAFLELLEDYRDAQLEVLGAKPENEMAIDAFLDKIETVIAFHQAYCTEAHRQETPATIEGFEAYISDFFSDEDERQCILFSTIHKAKGLEFNVVYVLPEKVPHPLAKNTWQYEQELNAEYVLLTRAKQAMYFIGRLITNLSLPTDEPTEPAPVAIPPPTIEAPPPESSVIAVAEAIVASQERKKAGGRPRKQKERLQIKVSSEIASYLRSLKGGDEGYSGYLETLVRSDPQFAAFIEQSTEQASRACV